MVYNKLDHKPELGWQIAYVRQLSHRTLHAMRWQRDNDTIYSTWYGPCTPEAIHSDYILQ